MQNIRYIYLMDPDVINTFFIRLLEFCTFFNTMKVFILGAHKLVPLFKYTFLKNILKLRNNYLLKIR